MAEEAPAAPATTPSKAAGKGKKKKAPVKRANRDGPSLSKQIVAVISESKERKGMSVAAMKKSLAASGVDVPKLNRRINIALVALVTKGILIQTTGIGASGSFKLAKDTVAKKPKKDRLPKKKPAAKKATTTTTTTTAAVAGRKSTAAAKKRRSTGKAEPKTKKSGKKAPAKKASKSTSSPRKAPASRAKTNPKSKKETPKKGRKPAAKKPAPKKAAKKAPGKKSKK